MRAAARSRSTTEPPSANWLEGLGLQEFVALDLETTGLDPTTCEIIEIGAVRFRDGRATEELHTLVRASRPLDPFITELTGITDGDLKDAPGVAGALEMLRGFLGTAPIAGQNLDFDLGFLRAASPTRLLRPVGDSLDSRYAVDSAMLARVFWPEWTSFSLASLCRQFGLDQPRAHRAADDARATGHVIVEIIRQLPDRVWGSLADDLCHLIEKTGHRSRPFFRRLCSLAAGIAAPRTEARERPEDGERAVLSASPVDLLGEGGPFERALPFFRVRPPQQKMASAVLDSFSQNTVLLAEAPTGIGKSLAYLVPALCWVAADPAAARQVVVSSHTKVLQEQLLRKDTGEIRSALGLPFRAAVLKGRNNYLCGRRLRLLLREADERLTDLERVQLMPLLRWAELTQTGDISEIGGFSARHQPFLWAQVASDGTACAGSACSAAKGDFHRLAQERAAKAQLVFVNHALLLSDLQRFSGPDKRLVMDEAHQIERSVVAALTTEVSLNILRGALSRLADERGARGLLPTLASREDADVGELQTVVRSLHVLCRQTFGSLTEDIAPMLTDSERSLRLRYRAGDRIFGLVSNHVGPLMLAWNACSAALMQAVHEFAELRGDERIAPELLGELRSLADNITVIGESVERAVGVDHDNEVRWIEAGRSSRGGWCSLYAAPVSVGQIMETSFWPVVGNAVLTSATLSVQGDFAMCRESLGLGGEARVTELTLDGPLDLRRQMRLFVPSFLPDPRGEDSSHTLAVAELVAGVVQRFSRGTMILCTSNEQVDRLTSALRPVIRNSERVLLSQLSANSLPELIAEFRRRKDAVLIGAASLWEGIDVIGDALEILLVTRLPFDVPTDPWVAARCDALQSSGRDPFLEYSVPTATIRLRQGIGRLIRHPDDRGVAIVTDPRLFRARYGRNIRAALPLDANPAHDAEDLFEQMKDFLERNE